MIEECRRLAEQQGALTKKAYVSATVPYDLGIELMELAQQKPVLELSTALLYRDGLKFALGIALPQRARALPVLESEITIGFDVRSGIWVDIPGAALKMRQGQKVQCDFVRRQNNSSL
ncbi:hypothetical protein [Ruegeria lacuscaerulensis]|uniref:hypothetical protein n=1 Tax=Ruegeria lacuscaerulensis TaxID=55218 RepID=UPI001481200D|nr:hypothetical protein [Ruegeria lacuscaerulensis]